MLIPHPHKSLTDNRTERTGGGGGGNTPCESEDLILFPLSIVYHIKLRKNISKEEELKPKNMVIIIIMKTVIKCVNERE